MYSSNGVGLAAPQINRDIRLFVVDSHQVFENLEENEKDKYPDGPGIRQVFINAHVTAVDGEEWAYNEGCLSIPKIREDIYRSQEVTLEYVDEHFEPHVVTFSGISARIIQHEYDHTEGKLFIDYLKPLKRKLLKGKLDDITKGKISVDYKMSFPR
jgi:peptide deformylase